MSDDFFAFLAIGGVLAITAVAFLIANKREKVRCEALAALASQLGLSYLEVGGEESIGAARTFNALAKGRDRKISNVITGSHSGVDIKVYDYSYVTGSGKNRSTTYLSVCQIESPKLSVPQFSVAPETFFHRIGEKLGMQDIDFDHYPDFSKSFVLKGTLEDEVRQAFGDPVIRYFEVRPGVSAEGMVDTLALIQRGHMKAENIQSHIQDGLEMFKAFVDAGNTRA